MASSSASVIELESAPVPLTELPVHREEKKESVKMIDDAPQYRASAERGDMSPLPLPSTAADVMPSWNNPRSNIARVAACFWSFIVMGSNDAAYGPLIPYIQDYYGLTYLIVSLIFLSPFAGYMTSALLNDWMHRTIGQRGVGFVCSVCHLVAYIIIAVHPPYPVLVVAFIIAGLGNGLADAAWNAWIGSMARANEVLGFLHGLYGLGAVLAPLISTSMITKAGLPWYAFYYIMVGMAAVELVVTTTCFWKADAREYKETMARHASASGSSARSGLRDVLLKKPAARVTWMCALLLLAYVGLEVALGGWIVEFMMQVRDGEPFASGMTNTGFWLGITIGRFVLGFVTPKIGEKRAVSIYLLLTVGLQLLFWLVPHFIVSAVAVSLIGVFLGPVFATVMVVMSKLLPRHLHVGAIGFAAACGSSGAAVLPFAVGAIAQAKGVTVLQPTSLALLVVILAVWVGLPRIGKKVE